MRFARNNGWLLYSLLILRGSLAPGQAPADGSQKPAAVAVAPPSKQIVIADAPQTIDPKQSYPPELAVPVTVNFQAAPLSDVVDWLRQQKLNAVADSRSLGDPSGSLDLEIDDALADEPLYRLLNNLRLHQLGWVWRDGVLRIASLEFADSQLRTVSYSVGDLIDAGISGQLLEETIQSVVATDSWNQVGGTGSCMILGDVLFVSQPDATQREVAGLLAALRQHGRRTFISEPPDHDRIRQQLQQEVSLDLANVPLQAAIERLSELAGLRLRLDQQSLDKAGIRSRAPVSVTIAQQKAIVVLELLLREKGLTWVLRDGRLWITTEKAAEQAVKVAVFDVRDLCLNRDEADSLQLAIENHVTPLAWEASGGRAVISFIQPGTMIVSHTEQGLDDVLQLLETYRAALRISKPRARPADDPQEVVVHYYRLPAEMARDLRDALPQLVSPETWKTELQPAAPGTILLLASRTERNSSAEDDQSNGATAAVPYSVLVVRQRRDVHAKIPAILRRVELGDDLEDAFDAKGQGGFGGGFF